MKKIEDKYLFILYLLVFLGIAATIAFLQPHIDTPPLFGNPPDEVHRYLIPRYICQYGKLPNGFDPEVRIPSYGISYAFYTMLPYIIQGFVMRFVNLFTGSEVALLYTARLVNVCFGTAMAAVVYAIGNRLFNDRRFKWLFCLLVMFLPQSLFIHTYVNTDSLCLFSTAVIVYALVRAYQDGFTKKICVILSLGIIICSLSYYNAYGYILSSILLFLFYFTYRKQNGKLAYHGKEMLRAGIFIAVIVLVGISWYFIRNAILYNGDFLGMESMKKCGELYATAETGSPYAHSYQQRGISIWQMISETDFFAGMFMSFVGAWGSVSIVGSIWMYRFYKAVLAVGVVCFFLLKNKNQDQSVSQGRKIFFYFNMIFCAVMPLALCIYYAYSMDFQNQGRYVMPGIIPIMYFVTKGLDKLSDRKWVLAWLRSTGVYAAIALVIGMLFLMTFGYAIPVYQQTGFVM
ncbi:MAG TPA: hypothetical protein VJY54_01330 [Lachnospiraceae bacterium]|nr:hypothetical protein [Lachnospiraceae bacterium]